MSERELLLEKYDNLKSYVEILRLEIMSLERSKPKPDDEFKLINWEKKNKSIRKIFKENELDKINFENENTEYFV